MPSLCWGCINRRGMASTTTITMRFLTTSLLLLITCCLWPVHGQNGDNNNIWDKPIQFTSKAKDTCSMIVSLQNDVTRLKVSCKSATREYSCEFLGRPHTCRSYNGNPRHYFTQIMWELRKLANACEGRRALKPQMCKRATDDAQMIFAPTASQERQPGQVRPEAPKVGTPKPATAQTKSEAAQIKPPRAKPDTAPAKPAQAKPEAPAVKSPRGKPLTSQTKPGQPKPDTAPAKATQNKSVPVKPGGSSKKLLPRPPKTTPAQPPEPTTKGVAETMAQEYCWEFLQGFCTYVIDWFHN